MPTFLLPRLLSRAGVASRRAAEQAVFDGRVSVRGKVCRDVLRQVDPDRDDVRFDGRPVLLRERAELVWVALNKPRGVVTTTADPEGRRTVLDLVDLDAPGLAPVGRLDQASAGLLLLTNDHATAARLLGAESHARKVYRVKVRGVPGPDVLERLATTSARIDGIALGPMACRLERAAERSAWLEVELHEGKNRQVRRRLEAEGHPVEVLVRVAFGPIRLDGLAPGAWRRLDDDEIGALRLG